MTAPQPSEARTPDCNGHAPGWPHTAACYPSEARTPRTDHIYCGICDGTALVNGARCWCHCHDALAARDAQIAEELDIARRMADDLQQALLARDAQIAALRVPDDRYDSDVWNAAIDAVLALLTPHHGDDMPTDPLSEAEIAVPADDAIPIYEEATRPRRHFNLRNDADFAWLADYFSGYHGVPGLRAAVATVDADQPLTALRHEKPE